MAERVCTLKDEAGSPLLVELRLKAANDEGWSPFQLQLRRSDKVIAQCHEEILEDDLKRLADNLKATANTGATTAWYPTEPSFLFRANKLRNNDVELLVIIDDGVANNAPTTDTGIAVLIVVEPDNLIAFADALVS